MITRVRTALIALVVLAPFLIFSGTILLEIFTIVMSCIGVFEILKCLNFDKKYYISVPAYLIAGIMPVVSRRIASTDLFLKILFFLFFLYMMYLMIVSVFSKGTIIINDIALAYVMILYIIFSFSCIVLLRDVKYGQYIYMLVFISAWMTDVGGYVFGRLFGKHKLIPDVSPNKTIEGAIGGIGTCVLSFCLYGFIIGMIFDVTPRYIPLIIIGFFMSIVSICGDLIASLIKRKYNVKDYGDVFPGHGGVMDRFDSIIATASLLYIMYTAFPNFVMFF
jgi:CDP-diglyceride synthetase